MDFLSNMPILNLVIIEVFIIVVIVLLAFVLKGKKVKIGNVAISSERDKVIANTRLSEREILKRQIHIARAVCANFKCMVPNYKNYSEKVIENTCFKVSDEIEDLILFNHLSTDKEYIDSRFQLIWVVIESSLRENFTEEDRDKLYDAAYKGFEDLVGILLNVRKENE